MRAAVCAGALALVLTVGGHAAGQTPDNTGTRLDPSKGPGSPGYEETLRRRDVEDLKRARQRGETIMPVLTGPAEGEEPQPVSPLDAAVAPEPVGEPELTEARTEPEPVQRVREQQGVVAPEQVAPAGSLVEEVGDLDAFVAVLVKAMEREPDIRRIVYEKVERQPPAEVEFAGEAPQPYLPRVGAGDAFYGRILHAVNSDYPGPVLIELLQPPLQGAVARGAFQLVRDRLVIRISGLDVAGETVPVDAVAVGLDCGCFGVSGDVSYHWWERLILPAAFGFSTRWRKRRCAWPMRGIPDRLEGQFDGKDRSDPGGNASGLSVGAGAIRRRWAAR